MVNQYFDRDLSWLGFNLRVLQEAAHTNVPLYERIRFLSIFSSNLDEFFRVRYPGLKALSDADREGGGPDVLPQVQQEIARQQELFGRILKDGILPALLEEGIHLYYGETLSPAHREELTDLFYSGILGYLQPVLLNEAQKGQVKLRDNQLYFLVVLEQQGGSEYALVNIPVEELSRFVLLPDLDGIRQIAFLDDVIREHLSGVFPGQKVKDCYSIKMTLNADIGLEDEWSREFEQQVVHMIEAREHGTPARLLHDGALPEAGRSFLQQYFGITPKEIIAGGRYHNLKDLAALPNPVGHRLEYPARPPHRHPLLKSSESVFDTIRNGDALVHLPYQQYGAILRFFNEAAIDPAVEEIYVTLYRVAARSHIVNALISAAVNGKSVTAFVELKARFDEANNLAWARKMKAAGVRIVYSIPGLKVHSKLALVKRRAGWRAEYFSILGTGNFNESTARFYTDHLLLTADKDLTREAELLFAYLLSRSRPDAYRFIRFEHLMVAQFNLGDRLRLLVEREIAHGKAGRPAHMVIKVNNLQEQAFIDLLYEASRAGVRIELIIRGICCLIPGVQGMSENITVRRIVDRYLEHGRAFVFHNNGAVEYFLGSSDLMDRNLHRRIEVVFPVRSEALKKEVQAVIDLQLQDNAQAVQIDATGAMIPLQPVPGAPALRAQQAIYDWVGRLSS